MRILKDNLLRASATIVESGVEDESFKFENMWDNRLVLQGKVTTSVYFDLGANYATISPDTVSLFIASMTGDSITVSGGTTTAADTAGKNVYKATDGTRPAVVVVNLEDLTGPYRYWKIESRVGTFLGGTPGGNIFLTYAYLGQYSQLPNARAYEEPLIDDTDNSTKTVGGQLYTQLGYTYKSVRQRFRTASQNQKDSFFSWYNTSDRANNNIFIQFEDDMVNYPPLFGKITGENERRFLGMKYYPFNINFREAK